MPCPTCNCTVQKVNDGVPRVFWCPTCGTLVMEGGVPDHEVPSFYKRTKAQAVHVRDGHEWGTFFYEASEPKPRKDGHGVDASANWTCNSSFGVFGNYWGSMGEPFAEFIRGVDADYLLGKIANKVLDDRKMVIGLQWLAFNNTWDRRCTLDEGRDALKAIRDLSDEYAGEVLATKLYEDSDVYHGILDYCEVETQSWDQQAVQFVKRLWPKFVEAVNLKAAAA